jgi:hypothetical protein
MQLYGEGNSLFDESPVLVHRSGISMLEDLRLID